MSRSYCAMTDDFDASWWVWVWVCCGRVRKSYCADMSEPSWVVGGATRAAGGRGEVRGGRGLDSPSTGAPAG